MPGGTLRSSRRLAWAWCFSLSGARKACRSPGPKDAGGCHRGERRAPRRARSVAGHLKARPRAPGSRALPSREKVPEVCRDPGIEAAWSVAASRDEPVDRAVGNAALAAYRPLDGHDDPRRQPMGQNGPCGAPADIQTDRYGDAPRDHHQHRHGDGVTLHVSATFDRLTGSAWMRRWASGGCRPVGSTLRRAMMRVARPEHTYPRWAHHLIHHHCSGSADHLVFGKATMLDEASATRRQCLWRAPAPRPGLPASFETRYKQEAPEEGIDDGRPGVRSPDARSGGPRLIPGRDPGVPAPARHRCGHTATARKAPASRERARSSA